MAPSCQVLLHRQGDYDTGSILGESNSSCILVEGEMEAKGPLCEGLPSAVTTGRMGRVRFSDDDRIVTIPCRSDLSLEEFHETWMSDEDYAELLDEIELTEAAMNSATEKYLVDDEILCSRGLNNLDNLVARAESNAFVQQLILHQIAHQISEEGTWDHCMVAKVYKDCSQPALLKAQNLARSDAEDAMRYLFET